MPEGVYARRVKKPLDQAGALVLLVLLSPVMAAAALLVLLFLGRPVLFVQERPGFHGKLFRCRKFRTMKDARDASGSLLPDGARLTRLGIFLRKLSLDELPQLFNILKGEMSFVGPRPLLVSYLDKYTPEQARRHNVRPGITGLAQIGGRNALRFSQRLKLDVQYVDQISFWLDLKILLKTLLVTLQGKGNIPGQDVRDVDDLGFYESAGEN